jgi:hypothetical protein
VPWYNCLVPTVYQTEQRIGGKMKNWQVGALSMVLIAGTVLQGCSSGPGVHEHYVSPTIQGESAQINLDAVQQAFWDTKGKDFNTWMGAFEKRVNEIYDGKDIVSVDATRDDGKLKVTGYINKVNKEGFQPGDDKLFTIEQTGDANNNEMPYRVADDGGRTYYEGHHSIMDNPILQAMLISHLMGGWGGRYYTPAPQIVVLQHSRDAFRASPSYAQTQSANRGFFSRFKTNSNGALTSTNKFGSGFSSSSSGAPKRSLFGGGSSSTSLGGASSSSGSSWGGRRSSGFGSSGSSFGSGFGSRRSFGGFRRR